MDVQEVREYVNYAQETIEESPQMDEANTKAAILQPAFLDLLGWEIPKNTELEYPVEAFGKTYWVDYALILDGTPVAFIEAKGVDTPLKDDHRDKVRDYLKTEDVNLGILTNVEEYEFFRRQGSDSKVTVHRLSKTDLQTLPEKVNVLEAYTKSAIQSDEWERILNRIEELDQARNTLTQRKDSIAKEVTQVLANTVSNSITGPAESQAKEMIDRLIEDIESEIDSDGDGSAKKGEGTSKPTSSEALSDYSGEYIAEIGNEEITISTFADDNQSDVMAEVVNYLIDNYDLISEVGPIPYVPGQKNALLNDKPMHPDGEREMRTQRELANGYYLFTSFNKKAKKRHLERLADKCNLEIEFEGGW